MNITAAKTAHRNMEVAVAAQQLMGWPSLEVEHFSGRVLQGLGCLIANPPPHPQHAGFKSRLLNDLDALDRARQAAAQ